MDITTLTTGKLNTITSTFIPGPGFPFSALYNQLPSALQAYTDGPGVPPPVDSLYYLMMDIVVYGLVTLYLDKVIPDGTL